VAEFDQAIVDKLKAEHAGAELHHISVASGDGSRTVDVIAKVPNRDRWSRFKAQIQDPHRKALAMEALVRDCVVFPDARARRADREAPRPGRVDRRPDRGARRARGARRRKKTLSRLEELAGTPTKRRKR
jgi:hypothetical protein